MSYVKSLIFLIHLFFLIGEQMTKVVATQNNIWFNVCHAKFSLNFESIFIHVIRKSLSNINTIRHQELIAKVMCSVFLSKCLMIVATPFSIQFTVNKFKTFGNTSIWLITKWPTYCH